MKQRFWRLLFAAFLAWLFGALLISALVGSLPLASYLFSALKSYYTQDKPFWEWLGVVIFSLDFVTFLIAFVLFAIILQVLGLFLGFALPAGRKYETTKLLRIVQSCCAEIIIILAYFFLIPYIILTIYGWTETTSKTAWANLYVEFIKTYWGWFLFFSVALYFATRNLIKRIIVALHTKFLGFFEAGHFGRGGSARFAGLFEELALRFNFRLEPEKIENTLFFGRSLYSPFLNIGIKDDRHAVTIAGSRSGKGTTSIIPNLLTWKGSALVIDTKGINAIITARRRGEMGQKVHIVDPFEILSKKTLEELGIKEIAGFNPLSILIEKLEKDPDGQNKKRIREDVGVLADALIIPDESDKGSHWEQGAKTVIAGFIAHLISFPELKDKRPTLQMIRNLLPTEPGDLEKVLKDMSQNKEAGGWAQDAGNRLLRGLGTDEIWNIMSNADKHSEFLGSEAIQDVLSKDSFKFSELKNVPTTIYLVIPPELLDEHRRFIRMFINSALTEMPKNGKPLIPILMILDEFQQLGVMKEVEKAYRLLAGYNFVIHTFFQDYSGIEAYGNGANSFISNSRAVQVFGLSDPKSLEFICKKIGGRSTQSLAGTNSMHTIPLRTTDEIEKEISAKGNKQYILRAGQAPLIIERVEYFSSEKGIFRWFLSKGNKRSVLQSDVANREPFIIRLFKNILDNGSKGSFLGNLFPFRGLYDKDPDYEDKKPADK
jgi:type IV secretory pathway TraG/TraD family ATPase VirD4